MAGRGMRGGTKRSSAGWLWDVGSTPANTTTVLPADLGQTLPDHAGRGDAAAYLTDADERRLDVPNVPTPDWVNRNTSFVYLAANADYSGQLDAQALGTTVMLHTRFQTPYMHPKVGPVVILTFADAHSELVPVAKAHVWVDRSIRLLDTVRTKPS